MFSNTISNTVTNTVTLGRGNYGVSLLVTSTGDIAPVNAGGAGIYAGAGLTGIRVENDGAIAGAAAASGQGGSGGDGIDFLSAGKTRNHGTITGGAGGYTTQGFPETMTQRILPCSRMATAPKSYMPGKMNLRLACPMADRPGTGLPTQTLCLRSKFGSSALVCRPSPVW